MVDQSPATSEINPPKTDDDIESEASLVVHQRLKKYRGLSGQLIAKPSMYTKELGDEVLDRIANGESNMSIARDPDMPSCTSIRRWTNAEYAAPISWYGDYARARRDQANTLAMEILELSNNADDTALRNARLAVKNLPPTATDTEKRRAHFFAKKRSIEATKIAIDARKWITSRLNPAKWGDKVTLEVEDKSKTGIDFSKLSTAQLERVQELQRELADITQAEVIDITPDSAPEVHQIGGSKDIHQDGGNVTDTPE